GKGEDVAGAAARVHKYLFDYGDLSPFEKSTLRNVVPFYTFARKNFPLQLESMVTKPGKIANLKHFQDFLQAREDNGQGVEASIVPSWMRRRIFGFSKDDDGALDIFTGLGLGFEEMSVFDRPFDEFAAMLNPMIKAPLQAALNKDFFRDIPLDKSELAPSSFRFFRHIPVVGPAFLRWLDYREVETSSGVNLYRANPRKLNTLWGLPYVAASARVVNTATQFERRNDPRQPDFLQRAFTGTRTSTLSPKEQIAENMRNIVEAHITRLEQLEREGVTGELRNKFYVRRDMVADDPRVVEARRISADIRASKKALKEMSIADRVERSQAGLRSGGR
ncbi:MAG TPA: hypothetical protein VM487_01530, partial [Phycisphaerae bacterium]|nr:hypothetical protein [Phycisphaerae bacterium]